VPQNKACVPSLHEVRISTKPIHR